MSKTVLVAPLNWGLGHATRCIPIIYELLHQGAQVILASDGRAYELLALEFPDLPLLRLPAYEIKYTSTNMVWNIASQSWKIISAIRRERKYLETVVREKKIDIIISDNRYGCYHPDTVNIFITHQINLYLPWFFSVVNYFNQRWISRFDECWVPDTEGEVNLSGVLSHENLKKLKLPVRFIGILSRMRYYQRPIRYDVVVVLSGPEPQRSILEEKILQQARELPNRFLIVQGKTSNRKHFFEMDHIEVLSYLTTKELNDVMLAGEVILSRAGYSTIMDMTRITRKAILIPTPGQTEQEYLSREFMRKKIFYTQSQNKLDLLKALQEVREYRGFSPKDFPPASLATIVKELLK